MITYKYQQQKSRPRRPSGPCAANAALSKNLGKAVVVVAAVLGSEIADALTMSSSVTRGTRASGPAKHGDSPKELAPDRQTRLKS